MAPSSSSNTRGALSSPISSTLAFAASFALPSRSRSPATVSNSSPHLTTKGLPPQSLSRASSFLSGMGNDDRSGTMSRGNSGQGNGRNNGNGIGNGYAPVDKQGNGKWDDAWDCGSDDESPAGSRTNKSSTRSSNTIRDDNNNNGTITLSVPTPPLNASSRPFHSANTSPLFEGSNGPVGPKPIPVIRSYTDKSLPHQQSQPLESSPTSTISSTHHISSSTGASSTRSLDTHNQHHSNPSKGAQSINPGPSTLSKGVPGILTTTTDNLTRAFSYTQISPPSPSIQSTSLGQTNPDWTILEKGEIQEAEEEYEGKSKLGNRTKGEEERRDVGEGGKGNSEGLGGDSLKTPKGRKKEDLSSDTGEGQFDGEGGGKLFEKGKGGKIDKKSGKEVMGKEALRVDWEMIMNDPLHILSHPTASTSTSTSTSIDQPIKKSSSPHLSPPVPFDTITPSTPDPSSSEIKRKNSVRSERRREKFSKVLRGTSSSSSGLGLGIGGMGTGGSRGISSGLYGGGGVDPVELRSMAWSGVPKEWRPIAWQMLLNYLPLAAAPRCTTLARKRREYAQLVNQTFARGMTVLDAQIWHQIEIDVPRTRPGVSLWASETTQRSLERILYVWAIRHPASGYVQGINDLVTPFFEVFLSPYIDCDPELFDCSCLPPSLLAAIEADTFWCLSKLLDGIQDHYIAQQPGIHRLVRRMGELITRIDAPLAAHFEEQGVEFMQFAFRWMNCLLMREISVKCTIRMWDTYLAEGTDAFSQFHLYVCSAFLVKWSNRLRDMDFQEIIMFLQSLPTQNWNDYDIELLLSESFVLKSVWQGAENHFAGMGNQHGPMGGGMGGR